MTELHDLTAVELLKLFGSKKLSVVEYYEHLVVHIQKWEPAIKALYAFDPDSVIRQARESQRRREQGNLLGELDGLPVTIKEMLATKGHAMPMGCASTKLVPYEVDSPVAARMKEAGTILIAKTTVPDWGMLSSGLSSFYGVTRNPWNLEMNTGGSSSGAGAAAAAGYGPLHIGSDIGGSVRLPAGWCGLVGFKATQGRIPVDPPYVGRCAGPMTRTMDDCALMMKYLSRQDDRDTMGLPPEDIDWSMPVPDLKGLRVGIWLDPGVGLQPEEEVKDAVIAAAKIFESAGATIVPLEPCMNRAMLTGQDHFWRARLWCELEKLPEEKRSQVLPYIVDWASTARNLSATQIVDGFAQSFEMRRTTAEIFRQCDFMLSPTNQISAYPADWPSPTNDPLKPFEHINFTLPFNMGEQPALSINCGFTATGMPIGLQIAASRYRDAFVLQLGKFYEDARGAITNWPQPSA